MYPVRAGRDSRYLRMLWKACEAYGALGQGLLIGFLDKKYRVAVNLLLAVTRFFVCDF